MREGRDRQVEDVRDLAKQPGTLDAARSALKGKTPASLMVPSTRFRAVVEALTHRVVRTARCN